MLELIEHQYNPNSLVQISIKQSSEENPKIQLFLNFYPTN